MKNVFIVWFIFFLPSIYSLKKTYMAWEPIVSKQTVEYQSVGRAKCMQPIATPQIDRQICKNKQEFSDFLAISYCLVHIVMLIIV